MISIKRFLQNTRTAKRFCTNNYKSIQLQPGLILIKNGLSVVEQIKLATIALQYGNDINNGFWNVDEQNQKSLNQSPHRGRIFNNLEQFPIILSELCQKNLDSVIEKDNTIKPIEATHLILLYYKTLNETPKGGYINWHQDKDANDGDNNYPVVSFTIGDTCEFLICNTKPKISTSWDNPHNLSHRILFESGDILIFGGPSRYIHHSIYKIHNKTSPEFLPFVDARLNFTFRYAPKISGNEDIFSSKNFKNTYT